MYISIHRHDGGNFFPGTGAPEETGEIVFELFKGYNISNSKVLLLVLEVT